MHSTSQEDEPKTKGDIQIIRRIYANEDCQPNLQDWEEESHGKRKPPTSKAMNKAKKRKKQTQKTKRINRNR